MQWSWENLPRTFAQEVQAEEGRARVRGLHILMLPCGSLEMKVGKPVFRQGGTIIRINPGTAVIEPLEGLLDFYREFLL
jgi:hypothetical protein